MDKVGLILIILGGIAEIARAILLKKKSSKGYDKILLWVSLILLGSGAITYFWL